MTANIKVVHLKRDEGVDLFDKREFSMIFHYDWLLSGAKKGKENTLRRDTDAFIFMDAELHRILNLLAGKQLAQIDGKYKKARLYMFETDDLYIAAVCETGDKGSAWFYLDKNNLNPSKGYSSSNDIYGLALTKVKQLSDFMIEMRDFLKSNQVVLESTSITRKNGIK